MIDDSNFLLYLTSEKVFEKFGLDCRRGLLWTGLLWTWLLWTGLFWTDTRRYMPKCSPWVHFTWPAALVSDCAVCDLPKPGILFFVEAASFSRYIWRFPLVFDELGANVTWKPPQMTFSASTPMRKSWPMLYKLLWGNVGPRTPSHDQIWPGLLICLRLKSVMFSVWACDIYQHLELKQNYVERNKKKNVSCSSIQGRWVRNCLSSPTASS